MTRTKISGGGRDQVQLSIRDWMGILGVLFTILAAVFTATLTLEQRLTEVITRQQQLEIRIERLEEQYDRGQHQ